MPTKPKTWFEDLFGAPETPNTIGRLFTQSIDVNGSVHLKSTANGRDFIAGTFSMPTLGSLRRAGVAFLNGRHSQGHVPAKITVTHKAVNDILGCHCNIEPGIATTFQAASQFNCLEFPGSNYTPELGITNYVYDNTQGPACAVACAAGTVYRNYFVAVNDNTTPGQTAKHQLNGLDLAERLLQPLKHWNVKNGYIFSDIPRLTQLGQLLHNNTLTATKVRDLIKVGVQKGTEVLMKNRNEPFRSTASPPLVTQVYCSAVSCSYSGIQPGHWQPFAQLVLDAAYESTLWAALLHSSNPTTNHYKVYLTFIGGGAFGNDMDWIIQGIARAIKTVNAAFKSAYDVHLEIVICHYRFINTDYVNKLNSKIYGTRAK